MIRMLGAIACAALLSAEASAARLPLEMVEDVPLSGKPTRFDYASLDSGTHRLFIAHLGDSAVTVFDTRRNRVVADIPGIDHVHGVLVVPELGRIYASATSGNEIAVIDAESLRIVARIPGGVYPDGMAYAPRQKKLYVSDEHGRTETVIDVRTNRRISTLPLGSEVGNSQYDPSSGHVFVNAQTAGKLIEIDPDTDRIVASHPLPGCSGPHGLLIDSSDRTAFVACQDNHRLLALNLETMKVKSSFGIGEDPDVLAIDPGRRRLYVATESGVFSIFDLASGMRKIWEGKIGDDAHVVAVDPGTHRVYLPLKDVGGIPVLRIMK